MRGTACRITLALGLVLAIGGCAPAGSPAEAPTPTAEDPTPQPTPEPTATPTEHAATGPDRIVVTAEAILVLAEDGSELTTFDYFQDTAEIVAGLTEVFGKPPVDTPFEGDNTHAPAGIERDWGGFAILDDEREPVPPHTPNHLVDVTAAEVDGITIETADGFAVGSPAAEALSAPDAQPVVTDTGQAVQLDAVQLDFDDPVCPEGGCTLSVRLFTDELGEVLARMIAPTPNFGP